MMFGPEFWIAIAFLGFVGILIYKKIPGMITATLDQRSEAIKKQLQEARELRNEAEALLEQQIKEQKDAARQVKEIAALAQEEAEIHVRETRAALVVMIERKSRMAHEKIAQAEAQAIKDVREVVINVAAEAARELLAEALKADTKTAIIDQAIKNLDPLIH